MVTWAITIPELNVYEQREVVDTARAQGAAMLIAMQHGCTPNTAHPWKCSASWSYERQVRLPEVMVPEREPHQRHYGLRGTLRYWIGRCRCADCTCNRGLPCAHCDDRIQLLSIPGGENMEVCMALPIKIPGRRTLLERNRIGESGTLKVSLVYDLMTGIAPDPEAVRDWELAGGKIAPEPAGAHEEVFK